LAILYSHEKKYDKALAMYLKWVLYYSERYYIHEFIFILWEWDSNVSKNVGLTSSLKEQIPEKMIVNFCGSTWNSLQT
jgi:hypothetical protein